MYVCNFLLIYLNAQFQSVSRLKWKKSLKFFCVKRHQASGGKSVLSKERVKNSCRMRRRETLRRVALILLSSHFLLRYIT